MLKQARRQHSVKLSMLFSIGLAFTLSKGYTVRIFGPTKQKQRKITNLKLSDYVNLDLIKGDVWVRYMYIAYMKYMKH
jgi:hypothetical protein